MQHVYGTFGLGFQLELSTRPDDFLGEIKTWDQAEDALDEHYPGKWEINPGDGYKGRDEMMPLEEFGAKLVALKTSRSLHNKQ
ncbi:hypothetical protein B0H14DRAFT_3456071 [Mycena olivaceomarginata]|nr:hypothetical protein B0H14DRAFT_3456071 [Mycena olivaceomarginata]